MANETLHEIDAAYDSVTAVVCDRLSRNLRTRRNLPGNGRVRIDRQLPFLCVNRTPAAGDDAGTCELVTTEAAYVCASGDASHEAGVGRLVAAIAETMREHFGAFLVVEIWAQDDRPAGMSPRDATRPGFCVMTSQGTALAKTLKTLAAGLREIRFQGWAAEVRFESDEEALSRNGRPLAAVHAQDGVYAIGIAVRPVYRDVRTGTVYPAVLRSLRRQIAVALRKGVFAFTGQYDEQVRATHYEALGPSSMVKSARLVDQELSEVSQSFDFVLQTLPLNSTAAWEEFQAGRCTSDPVFYYRPLPYDPGQLKRRLYAIAIDRIEDSTLIHLFAEKQDHLDRQLTALKNIGTPAFYYDGIQLYGQPDAELTILAQAILCRIEAGEKRDVRDEIVHADELVAAAREEIDHYHQRLPAFVAKVEVRNDLAASMMVAHERLFVSATASMVRRGIEPLLHHEIGTHLVTYFNGRQQPLQQLYAGFARYEELQEGLAVLAEYLVGGLTWSRLRAIACRVLAVQAMVDGRSFVDTYHEIHDEHKLPAKTAFQTTLRVYRGGGLTKDAIYLRGLRDLLLYLASGHDVEPLYVGKIALEHLPLVQELRRRGVIGPPALLPRFWDDPAAAQRLERCRRLSLLELVEHDN